MTPKSIISISLKSLFAVISLLLLFFIVKNFILLSDDMINGNFSAEKIKPSPHYPFVRVHSNPLTEEVNGVNRISADFAQIYFNSLSFSSIREAYDDTTPDPWERPSRYAPLIHAICLISFSQFDYGYASFLNMIVQLLLFLVSFVYAFKALKIQKFLLPTLMLIGFYLFLSPIGISFFGRGQFSLYVTLSYLWLILGIYKKNILFIIASAFFGYIKFTSFPFLLVALLVWIFNSKNFKEIKHSIFYTTVYGLTIIIFFITFLKSGIPFIVGALEQEAFFPPGGFSLVRVLPTQLVKSLPIILVILGIFHIKKYNTNFISLVPFLVGSAIILTAYPTLAYFYSVPYLFAFLPFLIHWSRQVVEKDYFIANTLVLIFILFLLVISFSIYLLIRFINHDTIVYIFILVSTIYLIFPLIYNIRYFDEK